MPNILAVAAMPEESQALVKEFSNFAEVVEIDNFPYKLWQANLGENTFYVVEGGVGEVNAASALASTISKHELQLDMVISTGTCGGMSSKTKVGNIILGEGFYYGKVDATMVGYKLGQVPDMPAKYTPSTESLTEAKQKLAGLPLTTGDICTSNVFFGPKDIAEVKTWIPDLVAVDMETTALAQIAHRFEINFLAIRCVSDLCLDDDGAGFTATKVNASDLAAAAVRQYVNG